MSSSPAIKISADSKYSIHILLLLIAAGLVGNYYKFEIFFNISFVFGGVFALLALQLLGLRRGIIAAVTIAAPTYLLWNHSYAILILIAEVASVGWLMERRKPGMVLTDTLFWLIAGMPLVYFFYHVVMHIPLSSTYIFMIKHPMNGIVNALAARLLFTLYGHYSRTSLMSFRENIYNLLAFFVLCPALFMLAVVSRADIAEMDSDIRNTLLKDSELIELRLDTWVENRKTAIINLAELASSNSARQMQPYLEQTRKSDINLLRVGLLNKDAITIAYSPLLDELGGTAIGKNFADRPFIPQLKQTLKPMLSEVVMGKIGNPRPIVVMLAPVVIRGEYCGYVSGTLNLAQIREYLDKSVERHASLYTLIDKNNNIITTNRSDQTVMQPFKRGDGAYSQPAAGVKQWFPKLPDNSQVSESWEKSFYLVEHPVGNIAEWKLLLEQPVAPFQKKLYDNYAGKLTLLFFLMLVVLSVAELISRRIMVSLEKLRKIASDLPYNMGSEIFIDWPESSVIETSQLVGSFQKMSSTVYQHVEDLEYLKNSLQRQVEERTEQLNNMTQELSVILDNAPCVVAKTIDRVQVWVNRKTEALFMYSKEELEFQTTRKLYPSVEAYEKLGLEAYPVLLEGLEYETVQEMVRKDGEHILVRLVGKAIEPDDVSKGIIWMLEDVTERKRIEHDLHEAKQFTEQILNSAQEGVVVFDLDLRYMVWNPFMEQLTGLTASEVSGKHPSELFPFLQASALIEKLDMVLSGETNINQDFEYVVQKTGKKGWVSDQFGPLLNSNGIMIGVLSTVREITQRKEMDEQLSQALENANKSNSTMSRLLRTIAHEFRTPLGILTGTTDIIDRYWDHLTPEKRQEQNEHIRNAANQLTQLVNSVMTVNQLGIDNREKPLLLMDIAETCNRIATDVESVWSVGHNFKVTISADCGKALLDRSLFRRILENLLTNALRYTPSNGGVLLDVKRENNRLYLRISDTGIGIPEEDQILIFDAFYRSWNVEGRRGMGLGLSILAEALTELNGTIEVVSRVGEGTTILVEIPLVEPQDVDISGRELP